ncbi:MAG: hypothetical protein RR724_04005, partial [Hydrogenoanaerobacterium sp.]
FMKHLFVVIFTFCVLFTQCFSAEADITGEKVKEQLDSVGGAELFDNTPQDAKELLHNMGVDDIDYKKLLSLNPIDFFKALLNIFIDFLHKPLVILASVIGVSVLCALIESLNVSIGQKGISDVFNVTAVLCACTAVVNPIVEAVRMTAAAIQSCADFILSFIPVFVSLVAVGGQPVSATTYNAFLLLIAEIISKITATKLVPIITIYLAFCIVSAFSPNMNLLGAAETAKTVVIWVLGLIVTVFVGLLGVQSMVASGADTVAVKAGKFLVGSFVPVVGKALADAFATAQGCLRLLKTTVGVYAVFVAALTFMPSFLQTLLWYFACSLGAAISDVLGVKQMSRVLKACGTALSLLIAILVFVALLFIVSITIMLITGMGVG